MPIDRAYDQELCAEDDAQEEDADRGHSRASPSGPGLGRRGDDRARSDNDPQQAEDQIPQLRIQITNEGRREKKDPGDKGDGGNACPKIPAPPHPGSRGNERSRADDEPEYPEGQLPGTLQHPCIVAPLWKESSRGCSISQAERAALS
jgi:hypothetical protein